MNRNWHPDVETYDVYDQLWQMPYCEGEAFKQYGILGWMGWSFGDFIETSLKDEDVAAVVATLGDLSLVATYGDYDEESNEPRSYRRPTSVSIVAQRITEDKYYNVGDLAGIKTLKELESSYGDHVSTGHGVLVSLCTEEEQERREDEQRRRELEGAAKAFAARKKLRMDTFEFIRAVEEELARVSYRRERWNDGETRMEEWAAHMYSGGGRESYFDDLNYENGRFADESDALRGILDWLTVECPLLMCKYEEEKASGRWKTEDEEAAV